MAAHVSRDKRAPGHNPESAIPGKFQGTSRQPAGDSTPLVACRNLDVQQENRVPLNPVVEHSEPAVNYSLESARDSVILYFEIGHHAPKHIYAAI
jgi:hypothetical protein